MKKLLCVCVLLVISAAVFAESAEIKLEYRHDGSKVNVYNEHNILSQSIENESVRIESLSETTETVKQEAPDLLIEAGVKVSSYKVDGEEQPVPPEAASSVFSFKADNTGRVTAVYDSDGKPTAGFDASKQIGLLPDKPVCTGDTWKGMLVMDSLNCPLDCRLEEVFTKNGVEIARISFTVDNTENLTDVLAEKVEGLSGSCTTRGSGNIYFSTKLGKYIMIEYVIDKKTVITVGDKNTEMNENIDYKMWRIK